MRRRLVKERSALQHDRPAFQDDLIHLVSLHADWLGELFAADRVSARFSIDTSVGKQVAPAMGLKSEHARAAYIGSRSFAVRTGGPLDYYRRCGRR